MYKMCQTIMCHNDELSSMISWVGCFLNDSELFYLICRKYPNPSQNFCYSHSLNFHVSGSTKSVSKQPTQLIVKLNSSLGHIIVTVVCRQMCTIQCIGYKQTGLGKIDFLINFLNYINIRCFHQIVSLIFSKNFSQFEQLKKKS